MADGMFSQWNWNPFQQSPPENPVQIGPVTVHPGALTEDVARYAGHAVDRWAPDLLPSADKSFGATKSFLKDKILGKPIGYTPEDLSRDFDTSLVEGTVSRGSKTAAQASERGLEGVTGARDYLAKKLVEAAPGETEAMAGEAAGNLVHRGLGVGLGEGASFADIGYNIARTGWAAYQAKKAADDATKNAAYEQKYYGTPAQATQTRKQRLIDPTYPQRDWQESQGETPPSNTDDTMRNTGFGAY